MFVSNPKSQGAQVSLLRPRKSKLRKIESSGRVTANPEAILVVPKKSHFGNLSTGRTVEARQITENPASLEPRAANFSPIG
jgi:hypothetical protein